MKKLIHSSIAFVLLIFMVSFNGCDELQTLPLNVPIPFEFETTGNSSSYSNTSTVCISEVQELVDNQDKIKEIKFINAAFWAKSTTQGLRGDLSFSLKTQSGATIFSINLPSGTVGNYLTAPLVLSLSASEIQFLESYLSSFVNNNECFVAEINIQNITPVNHDLKGKVEVVVEATVEF